MKTEEEKKNLLQEILVYGNQNSSSFQQDVRFIPLEDELNTLGVVLEALSKDTVRWGDFIVALQDHIFNRAYQSHKTEIVLNALMEFAYFEKDILPYVQKLVDRMFEELHSSNLIIQQNAIWYIVPFLKKKTLQNTHSILQKFTGLIKSSFTLNSINRLSRAEIRKSTSAELSNVCIRPYMVDVCQE